MNRVRNCQNDNCRAENSIIPVITLRNYTKAFNIPDSDKQYRTHSEITVFCICKKCSWMTNYNRYSWPTSKAIFKEIHAIFWIYLPNHSDEKIKELKSSKGKRKPTCIECGKDSISGLEYREKNPGSFEPTGREQSWPLLKLYLKRPRKYLGYYCHYCNIAYCIPVREINWNKGIVGKHKIYDVIRGDNVFSGL